MTFKDEIRTLKNLPKVQRLIVAMKVAGVFLVAIGFEGLVTRNWAMAILGISTGIFVSLLPIKVRLDRCIACLSPISRGEAICRLCGAPQM